MIGFVSSSTAWKNHPHSGIKLNVEALMVKKIRIIKRTIALLMVIFVASCVSPIAYEPSSMSAMDAREVMDQLIMTQHRKWKPDYFEINNKYILWGYGTTSKSKGGAATINNVSIGSSTTVTRSSGNRLYFNTIKSIQLMSWKRKLKQWYVVSVLDKYQKIHHVYRTRDIHDAKRFTDAMETIVSFYKPNEIAN